MDRQTHRQLEKQSIFIDIGDKYKICWMFKYILYWRIKINWILVNNSLEIGLQYIGGRFTNYWRFTINWM